MGKLVSISLGFFFIESRDLQFFISSGAIDQILGAKNEIDSVQCHYFGISTI